MTLDQRRTAVIAPRHLLLESRVRPAAKQRGVAELADGLARDVGDLVQVANSTVRDLLTECPADDPMQERLENVREAMQRVASIVRQLNTFARLKPVRPNPTGLNSVVAQMEPLLQSLVGPFIALKLSLNDTEAWVAADPMQLEQVLFNLVVHARDSLPLGGRISVTTRHWNLTEPRAYWHGSLPEGDWAVLEVRDNGSGLDEGMLPQLFEPAMGVVGLGVDTGLGLATVAEITRQVGGHVVLDSAPDAGTAITVCLPASEAPRERRGMRGTPEAILVLDEDEWMRTTTVHTLRRAGYAVLEADHASAALDLLRDVAGRCIRLILVDAMLPAVGGRAFAEAVRRDRPEMPVIVMAGRLSPLHGDGAIQAIGPTLVKPFTSTQLLLTVREHFTTS